MSRWKVTKAFGVWYAIEHGWKHYKSFPAWAKAMSYADRKSRQPLGITIKAPSGIRQDVDYAKLIEKRLGETCTTHKN